MGEFVGKTKGSVLGVFVGTFVEFKFGCFVGIYEVQCVSTFDGLSVEGGNVGGCEGICEGKFEGFVKVGKYVWGNKLGEIVFCDMDGETEGLEKTGKAVVEKDVE